ncbi:uncharacterized protein V6R79_025067 [Siganus canaliculatus]
MADGGVLEPLVISEEGDIAEGVSENEAGSGSVVIAQTCSGLESTVKEEEEHAREEEKKDIFVTEMCLSEQSQDKQQSNAEDELMARAVMDEENAQNNDKKEQTENMTDGQNGGERENEGKSLEEMGNNEKPGVTEDEKVTQKDPQVEVGSLNPSEQQHEEPKSKDEDPKKTHRLTPDFPEALYDLLCTLQEGRRLNDQRCSFTLDSGVRRRRCHSEPNTTKPANRVIFSSMTSLQKEEFFELVATAQARRLDDQRAQLERSPPIRSKFKSFRGSIRQLSLVKKPVPTPAAVVAPVPVPKEDLYNMILTTQAQGRLEDQRSRAPGPMDDEDFFSLLLRVQGGRMDEQRTELPCLLQT